VASWATKYLLLPGELVEEEVKAFATYSRRKVGVIGIVGKPRQLIPRG